MPKTSFGIRIENELLEKLDRIVSKSRYLQTSRSEVVEAILAYYFKTNHGHLEWTRKLIIKKREGKL
jgi:metal-responsive CopG/Arc/MetJ family transcriptional regulator